MPISSIDKTFEAAPIPLWDEDVSALYSWFRDLRRRGVRDLSAHLARDPAVAEQAVALTVVERVNAAALALMGAASEGELTGNIADILTPDSQWVLVEALVTLFGGGRRFEADARHQRIDGSEVDVRVTVALVDDSPGSERLLVSTQDISDRIRAAAQLRESRARLEAAQAAAGLGTFDYDAQSETIGLSERAAAILDLPSDGARVPIATLLDRILPGDRKSARASLGATLWKGTHLDEVHRLRRGAERTAWIRLRGQASGAEGQPAIGVLGTIEDVTIEHQAAVEREEQLTRLRAMNLIGEAINLAGGHGEIPDRVVEAVGEIFGADRAFLIYPCDPEAPSYSIRHEYCRPEWPGAGSTEFPMDPATAESFRDAIRSERAQSLGPPPPPEFSQYAVIYGVQSQLSVAVRPTGDRPWLLALHACSRPRPWTDRERELLEAIGRRLADALASASLWQALQRERERLDLALSGSGSGLWDWSITQDTVTIDGRYHELLGYAVGTIDPSSLGLASLTHPDDRAGVQEALREIYEGRQDRIAFEYRVQHGRGHWIWVLVHGQVAARDDQGLPLRVAGTLTDISARKEAELALAEEKERAEVTLHSIGDAVITTDHVGRVQYLNPVAEQLTGWTAIEAGGRPIHEVFHIVDESSREPAHDPVKRVLRDGQVVGLANHTVLLSRTGREYAIRDSAAPIRDRTGAITGVVLVFTDETEARLMAQRITYEATHDSLTGLVNRREFEARLKRAIASAADPHVAHTLCYLDLDQFKLVNDTAGHTAGDELLRQVAGLLSRLVRSRDTLARLGGDEFSLLLEHCPIQKGVEVAHKLMAAVRGFQFTWAGQTFQLGVSIGVVAVTAETGELTEVLARADLACYAAKDLGRGRVHVYRVEDDDLARRRGEMVRAAELAEALKHGRFCLHAQPILHLGDARKRPHFELLLRMLDPQGELVLPGGFIPAAERFDLMHSIDRWVLTESLRTYPQVFAEHGAGISINLSGSSLSSAGFLDFVLDNLAASRVPAERICFEITETAAVANLVEAREFIGRLGDAGCTFALDDFGSGLSSFAYLKELPVDFLKIDGQFLRGVVDDPVDRAMVAAINELAHTMGIRTIGEYIETTSILETARALGVDFGQGFGIGRPVALDKIMES